MKVKYSSSSKDFKRDTIQWSSGKSSMIHTAIQDLARWCCPAYSVNQKERSTFPSMSRAIKALLDKGLIIDIGEKGLRVYNVFIEKNLKSFPYN